jgi:hypothetical protein
MVSASIRKLLSVAAAVVLCACHPDAPLVVRTDTPMVYLILTPDSLESPIPELRALVANTGTPMSLEYVTPDRFTMRRKFDGSSFDWQATTPIGTDTPFGGNYALAESASVAGLGRRDLKAGQTYTLEIALGDRVIIGQATIPEHPRPRLVVLTNGSRMVVWPKVAAAAAYGLEIDTDIAHTQTTADTFYLLHDDFPAGPESRIVVTAMDSNWARYRGDSTATREGLTGAYGVFGAMSRTALALPSETGR